MDQEKKEEKEAEEKNRNQSREKVVMPPNSASYFKSIETMQRVAQEATQGLARVVAQISASGIAFGLTAQLDSSELGVSIATVKAMEQQLKITHEVIAKSLTFPIISPSITKALDDMTKSYSALNDSIESINGLNFNPVLIRQTQSISNEAIRNRDNYIKALEKSTKEKDEEIKRLNEIINEKNRKVDYVS